MFDIAKAAEEGPSQTPWLTLRGHGDEGFGCAWSPHTNGQLTTCANDGTICGWDIATAKGGGITPTYFASRGESAVAEVQYSPKDPYTICAAGDDKVVAADDAGTRRAGGCSAETAVASRSTRCSIGDRASKEKAWKGKESFETETESRLEKTIIIHAHVHVY